MVVVCQRQHQCHQCHQQKSDEDDVWCSKSAPKQQRPTHQPMNFFCFDLVGLSISDWEALLYGVVTVELVVGFVT